MQKVFFIALFPLYILCENSIKIALSSNMVYVFNDLQKQFSKIYPNINIRYTLGSSGKLVNQIRNNAAYDMFLSANYEYARILYEENRTKIKPKVYAKGFIVYFSKEKVNFKNIKKLIISNDISKISIANPKIAPYGKASMEVLENLGIYDKIKEKLIFASSISQALQYGLYSNSIAIVAKSAMHSPFMKKYKQNIHWDDVNISLYKPIRQSVVVLKGANNKHTKKFYDFLFSPIAQKVFINFGYAIP